MSVQQPLPDQVEPTPFEDESSIIANGRCFERILLLLGCQTIVAAFVANAFAQTLPQARRPRALTPHPRPAAFRDRLLPAPVNGGFRLPGYWVWGGSAVKGDDGRFHLFASRWPRGLPFGPHWLTNSEIVHAVSSTPEGPYAFVDVALPPRGDEHWDGKMSHNPVVRRVGDRYALYYTGTTYRGPMPAPGNPTTETSALKLEAHQGERIGLATAASPDGPWLRRDRPILDVRPDSWEQYLVSNSSPLVLADGSILLYYKGVERLRQHAISVARAANLEGPYERLSDKPFHAGVGAEDPTMWLENGRYHALMLDHDKLYSNKEIYYATSPDGLKWTTQPNPVAVTKNFAWDDGVARRMASTERPQILVQNGVATHLFIATGAKVDGKRQTWNQVIPLKPESSVPDRVAWWRAARFGLLIHWGVYAIPGGIWKGKPLRDARFANPYCEHLMWLERVPLADYAELAERFRPDAFDARAIVAAAKAAGMKYVVFTAKHHDGFAMYHSKVSPYNVVDATPWQRDPLRELADACREAGLRLGFYYSLCRDWSHPHAVDRDNDNFWDFPAEGRKYQRYLDEKAIPQLIELLTEYGPMSVVWFDAPVQTTLKQSIALELLVRRLQPQAVINTRLGNGLGDYDEMSNNKIPARSTGRDFETPATMAESWGYSRLDGESFWKSSRALIRQLIDIASKGGNYLLNVGLDGRGAVPGLAKRRLDDMAQWMKRHAESIHGSTASSLAPPAWGRFTQRDDTLYAHVFEWPEQSLLLPVDRKFVSKIELLGEGPPKPLRFAPAHGAAVLVSLPAKEPNPYAAVLRVTLR